MSAILLLLFAAFAATTVDGHACANGKQLDIMFLVDGSANLCDGCNPDPCPNWVDQITFINSIVKDLTIGPDATRVSFVNYGSEVSVIFNLTRYTNKKDVMKAIEKQKYNFPGGELTNTELFRILLTAVFAGPTPAGRQRVLVLLTNDANVTDEDAANTSCTVQQASEAPVLIACITDRCKLHCAQVISSPPHQAGVTYWMVPEYSQLPNIKDSLERQLCALPVTPGCVMEKLPCAS